MRSKKNEINRSNRRLEPRTELEMDWMTAIAMSRCCQQIVMMYMVPIQSTVIQTTVMYCGMLDQSLG